VDGGGSNALFDVQALDDPAKSLGLRNDVPRRARLAVVRNGDA
jgi:hypothetical protein